MFGWRKKREGFEWHEYVRTTILLRRVNRRRKIDAVREAAIDGLKGARRAAASGLDNAKAAAASGLREAADKGSAARTSGLQSGIAALSASVGAALAASARFGGAVLRLPVAAFAAIAERARGASAAKFPTLALTERLRPLAVRLSASRLGAASAALPIGAVGVAAAAGAVARYFSHGIDETTVVAALLALASAVVVLLPGLAGNDGAARDQAIKDRGGRPRRSDYSPSDDITHANPLIPRQAGGMLLWGGLGALAVLGLGPLLSSQSGGEAGSRGGSASAIVTSSISREPRTGALEGHATALGGDTLRVSGRIVRLAGIEAPEAGQSCQRDSGTSWQCGEAARRALERFTRRDTIACEITEARADGPSLATCRTAAGTDIAGELVRGGHAFAETGFFASYSAQQDEARAGRKGLWSGTAQRPSEYRTTRWEEARKAAPAGCPIKGQLTGRNRTYVLPWSPDYDRVKVRDKSGGRWFCSEDEARSAGWQPAHRS